jgi:hypothetical protein
MSDLTPEQLDALADIFEHQGEIGIRGHLMTAVRQAARDARALTGIRAWLEGQRRSYQAGVTCTDGVVSDMNRASATTCQYALAELDRLTRL